MRRLDLTGMHFGKLVAIAPTHKNGRAAWECLCDCGNRTIVTTADLNSGNTKSCGCSLQDARLKTADKLRGRVSPRRIDLTGQRFGRLVVLSFSKKRENDGALMWNCQCDCGNTVEVRGDALRNGVTTSCGCFAREVRSISGKKRAGSVSPRFKNLTGHRFGRLTVISRAETTASGVTRWNCVCDCGKHTIVASGKLNSGKTQSCGCLGLERATAAKIKHGDSAKDNRSKLYGVWCSMRRRCENEKVKTYRYYGGKGVKVCEDWHDYPKFKEWAHSHGYEETLTIDRIDSNGNYCPENCRWITAFENNSRAHKKTNTI